MKDRAPQNVGLKAEINRTIIVGIKSYPQHQILAELFARYVEVLSTSRDVDVNGSYLTSDVMNFFANTTKWLGERFNPLIKNKIAPDIAAHTAQLIQADAFKQQKKFSEKVDSFYKRVDNKGQKTWSANTKSNSNWQKSWNQHQKEIEDKKNNN